MAGLAPAIHHFLPSLHFKRVDARPKAGRDGVRALEPSASCLGRELIDNSNIYNPDCNCSDKR
jgi:hypothetical protein